VFFLGFGNGRVNRPLEVFQRSFSTDGKLLWADGLLNVFSAFSIAERPKRLMVAPIVMGRILPFVPLRRGVTLTVWRSFMVSGWSLPPCKINKAAEGARGTFVSKQRLDVFIRPAEGVRRRLLGSASSRPDQLFQRELSGSRGMVRAGTRPHRSRRYGAQQLLELFNGVCVSLGDPAAPEGVNRLAKVPPWTRATTLSVG
jgi:hypothetical protein